MDETIDSPPHPIVLFYNEFFGAAPDVSTLDAADRNAFSWDRSLFAKADAVIFHVPDMVFSNPNLDDFAALQKPPGQLWVAWSMESAVNYPVLKNPAFIARFDLVMSYARTADIWISYCPDRAQWLEALSQPLPVKTETVPLVMFQSALNNRSGRNEYASELMTKIKVDSYGRFLTNRPLREPDRGRSTKLATIARYKFCLSLENALEIDYVTEKFFDPLLVGTVPVYRGAPNIDRFAPGDHSFINANKFTSPSELAAYLKELDRDDEAYRRFFQWRDRPLSLSFVAGFDAKRGPAFAKLVAIVRGRRKAKALRN
jgi:Glycosyltransferase family 10 (fucosyltransferase) C-term/Fucosyltransferase, N-terminal